METSQMVKSARYPDSFNYGIQPLVRSIVAEMDDMSVLYPTQEMHETILNRVYEEAIKMYPNDFESESADFPEQNTTEQFFPPFRRRRLLRDLLGVLILFELFDRRSFRR